MPHLDGACGFRQRTVPRRGRTKENGLYALPEFQILTNYRTGNSDIYVAPEIGYSHKKTIYVKPGLGIDQKPGDRQWGIDFGARVQF